MDCIAYRAATLQDFPSRSAGCGCHLSAPEDLHEPNEPRSSSMQTGILRQAPRGSFFASPVCQYFLVCTDRPRPWNSPKTRIRWWIAIIPEIFSGWNGVFHCIRNYSLWWSLLFNWSWWHTSIMQILPYIDAGHHGVYMSPIWHLSPIPSLRLSRGLARSACFTSTWTGDLFTYVMHISALPTIPSATESSRLYICNIFAVYFFSGVSAIF